jgi:UDP-N-acetylmuramate--alanine ligase
MVDMNIYFSGIGGVGLGPLAEIALDAGNSVVGSDPKQSLMTEQMSERGIKISTDQTGSFLQSVHAQQTIDWFVYTSALPPNHPELLVAKNLGIRTTKRDELIDYIIREKDLKLIAVAGTHGKTTTTSLFVWAFKQLGIPISYSVGTTLSFGPSGHYDPASKYFVYECDEYDRNFLQFHPYLAVIPALSYDHPDTYPTSGDYTMAFRQFLSQSDASIFWKTDEKLLGQTPNAWVLGDSDIAAVTLIGEHVRRNASLVVKAFERLDIPGDAVGTLNKFPGASRRFEKLGNNLYSDYAIHPIEIALTLAMARELNNDIVVVYQPHQNVRQHEVMNDYTDCFSLANDIYWLPTYLTREDPSLPVLTRGRLTKNITNKDGLHFAELDDELWGHIETARKRGALVVCMGAGSIDAWVREKAASPAAEDRE